MGDEERLNGDEGRGVLHDPMHDATIDVYVFPLAGFIATGGALQPMSLRVMAVSPGTLMLWF